MLYGPGFRLANVTQPHISDPCPSNLRISHKNVFKLRFIFYGGYLKWTETAYRTLADPNPDQLGNAFVFFIAHASSMYRILVASGGNVFLNSSSLRPVLFS